jgi:3-oxoacyl-[acyl-carrier-protein] synthase II
MDGERGRRVVVTGMGMLTPVGLDVSSTWSALVRGQSGVARVEGLDTTGLDVSIAGQIKGFEPADYLDRKEARRLDRFLQIGVAAAQQAVADAQLTVGEDEAYDVGVLVGSGIGGISTLVDGVTTLIQKGPDRVSPFLVPMFLPDMLSGMIAIQLGARGPNYSANSACATAGHCLGEAAATIRRGDARVMLAGASEAPVTRIGLAAFNNMRALSRRNHAPEQASRPFDLDRDGFVLAEAAGVLVLEDLEHALARGAAVYAEIAGYAATADAYHITAPPDDGAGAARAMRLALCQAGLRPEDIGYINAHGTSTPHNDRAESAALVSVFGPNAPPVSSTKSMTGHLIGASGAVEAIVCIKTILDGCLPPTINYDTPDPDCPLDYVPNMARAAHVDAALSNSLGFGGHNTALIVRRYEG